MQRIKQLLSVLVAAMLIISLAACASGGEGTTPAPAQSSDTPAAENDSADTPPPVEATGEQVVVTFWDMQVGGDEYPSEAGKLAATITEDHPNIVINYQSIPWANRYETFTTAIASGEAPDFSTGGGYQSFQFAGAGEILDVSSIVDEWEAEGVLPNYNQDLITYFQYNGMQVGIPWNYEPRYVLYRTDWFEEAGISAPTNWDQLYDAAVHFTDPDSGVYGMAYPTSGSSGNVLFNIWFGMNGTGIWSEDGQSLDWTNPKNVETLDFIRRLSDAGVFPEGMAAYENTEVVQLALQDSVAMIIITGGNDGKQFAEAGKDGSWAVLECPAGPSANGNQGFVAAVNAIMAYSQTAHTDETKQAMKWWCENMIQNWTNTTAGVNGIPVRNDWLQDSSYRSTIIDPFMSTFIDDALEKTHTLIYPATNINGWLTQNTFDGERWWTALSQAVFTDSRSSEELLEDWQRRAEEVLADFGE